MRVGQAATDQRPVEMISELVGHRATSVAEIVYRHQIRPVIQTGATVMARMCNLCGQGFEVEVGRQGGRPRVYCLTYQPEDWKVVLPKHRFGRVKLRRLRPYQRLS